MARFLLSPQEENLPLRGSVSLGLPLLVKPQEGTIPRVQGRASEPETRVPSPVSRSACQRPRAPAPWAGTNPDRFLDCLSSLESTHLGPSLPLNSMWWRQKFLRVWTAAFLPLGVSVTELPPNVGLAQAALVVKNPPANTGDRRGARRRRSLGWQRVGHS